MFTFSIRLKNEFQGEATVSILEKNLIEIYVPNHKCYDSNDVLRLLNCIKRLSEADKTKYLIVIDEQTQFTNEAIKLFILKNRKRAEHIAAEAIVYHSVMQNYHLNLYYNCNKDYYNIKFFQSYSDAYMWLNKI